MHNLKSQVYCIECIISLVILMIFNKPCTGILKGPNVCVSHVEDKPINYCCFNYYLIDGHCHECKLGTTSVNGRVCIPCPPNSFGYKCQYECHCESHQRCNPKFGCLDKAHTSSAIGILSVSESQNDSMVTGNGTETSETNPVFTSIAKSETNPMLTTIATPKTSTGFQILNFMLVAAVLIITLSVLCWTCNRLFPHNIPRLLPQMRNIPICQRKEVGINYKV